MSREFELGLKTGRGSLVFAQKAFNQSLGEWAVILPYLENMSSANELELVASINYILGKDLELTPPLKSSLARDYVSSNRKILISDVEFMLSLGGGGEEKKGKEEQKQE